MHGTTLARGISDILAELDASYSPQKQAIQQRLDALPAQADAEIAGLQGQQTQAFDDILAGARQRGLGFSGIPLGEQAKYTSNQFLPAVARVRQSQNDVRGGLFDALNNVNLDQRKTAMGVYQQELDRDEASRQANAQRSAFSGLFNPTTPPPRPTAPSASINQRPDKGFNFTDANGRSISAAQFAATKGIPFRKLLQEMASAGDTGAKQALGFVGDDYGYDPRKLNSQSLAQLYNNLVWGTGLNATYTPPQPNKLKQAASQVKSVSAPTLGNANRINSFFNYR